MSHMLGFRSSAQKGIENDNHSNGDLTKLFFDSFSKRVTEVEKSILSVSSELERLKGSLEKGQISDLVLLDRVKRTEELVRESFLAIRASLENAMTPSRDDSASVIPVNNLSSTREPVSVPLEIASIKTLRVAVPVGEIGSLPSITTTTELQVLTLLATEGAKSAPEIGKAVGRSREHTARLMKKLYQDGYVRRDQTRIPFKYSVVEKVKQSFEKAAIKDEEREPISVPQT